jgi:protein involved in polysaccharide export with SLBB domain
MSLPSRCSLLSIVLTVAAVASRAGAQVPSPAQAQRLLDQAQQDPTVAAQLRARLQQSGLTPEQIRARLRASGYSETLLDAYLGADGALPGRAPGSLELAAFRALGLPPIELAQDVLPVDTGLIDARGRRLPPSRVFGVDVFRRSTTQFLPTLAGPVPPDYRLGPGDVVALIVTGDVELTYTLQVVREGYVLIPQVGQVHVANLTLDQLRDVLYTRLGRVYSGVRRGAGATTRFDVTVVNVRAIQVYVAGDVAQPGAYQISSLGSVLTALYAAGGVTETGNMRQIEVRRLGRGTAAATFDLYDYLLRGDPRNDIRLATGDVVFVPVHGVRAEVSGAVVRPAIYEVKPGETLADLVRAAGGFRADAARRRVAVHRILPAAARGPGAPARTVIDVQLSPTPADAIPTLALEDGDSVVVDSIRALADQFYVAIAGMVRKPGAYPWREGMTLRDLVLLARGPLVGADLREAEIARLPEDRSRGQLARTVRVPLDSTYLYERDSAGRYVGPPGVTFPAPGVAEVPLEPYDNVLVFRQPEFDFQRTVTLTGEVRFPGSYSLRAKDERLTSLIQRAGGLTPRAYPEGIRFVRTAGAAGRINIDLPRALRDTTSRDNVILQPADSIEIPEYLPSVKVVGAVNSPASVLWRSGASLGYYISAAGGFAAHAEKGRVSVKFANGETRTRNGGFLFFGSTPRPGPGSEVFVPAKDPSERTDYVALMGAIAQILASTVAIIVVATR